MAEVTVYSSIADGYSSNQGIATWEACRDAGTGSWTSISSPSMVHSPGASQHLANNFRVFRSFFYFDLASLPSGIIIESTKLCLYGKLDKAQSGVTAQEGTQSDSLTNADFDAFIGSEFGRKAGWSDEVYNEIIFNSAGQVYLENRAGIGTAKICCRESLHDYDDSAPAVGEEWLNGIYYANNAGETKDPKLVITYSVPPTVELDSQSVAVDQQTLATDIVLSKQSVATANIALPNCAPQAIGISQKPLGTLIGPGMQGITIEQLPTFEILLDPQIISIYQAPVPLCQTLKIGLSVPPLATDTELVRLDIVSLQTPLGTDIDLDKQIIEALQKPLATVIDVLKQIIALAQASPDISDFAEWTQQISKFTNTPVVIMEISLDDGVRRYTIADTELDGLFYEGRVLQFGTIHRAISDTEGYFEISDVTTRFANTDGIFSTPADRSYLNREVRYRLGFVGAPLTAFMTVFRGVIASYRFAGTCFEMTVKNIAYKWFGSNFGHIIDETDWPFAASGVAGSKMPILYGDLTGTI